MADECLPSVTSYRILFEVRLLHHYWLDRGAVFFDKVSDQAWKDRVMLSYDISPVIEVSPTSSTEKRIRGLRGIYKKTPAGFILALPSGTGVPDGLIFEFAVVVKDPSFYNYTAFTVYPRTIRTYQNDEGEKVSRFRIRENIAVLSNITGVRRGNALCLSREYQLPVSGGRLESLYMSEGGGKKRLEQVTSEKPGAALQLLCDDAGGLPVFIHQGDVPVINAPDWITTGPLRGIELTGDVPDNTELLIRMSAARTLADNDFCFVDAEGKIKGTHPVYEVHFKNRPECVIRKNGEEYRELDSQPLTYY